MSGDIRWDFGNIKSINHQVTFYPNLQAEDQEYFNPMLKLEVGPESGSESYRIICIDIIYIRYRGARDGLRITHQKLIK